MLPLISKPCISKKHSGQKAAKYYIKEVMIIFTF